MKLQTAASLLVKKILDYPDDSAGENSVENNGEFRFTVMAGLDPAIQSMN